MDDSLLRKVLSAGDLADRLMINVLKAVHIPSKKDEIQAESEAIGEALKYLTSHVDKAELANLMARLHLVLSKQWDMLDLLRDSSISNEERGRYAVAAQDINIERVYWKNQINALAGSCIEHKKYGKTP